MVAETTVDTCLDNSAERHDDEDAHRTTIFVRNLPFDTRNDQLEKEFSEIGPVKRAFVVKDKDKRGSCRGFGYVQFALQEDADKATKCNKSMGNRKLKLSYAAKKPKHKKRKELKKENDEEDGSLPDTDIKEQSGGNKVDNLARSPAKKRKIDEPKKDPDEKESKEIIPSKPKLESDSSADLKKTIVLTGLKEKVKRKAFRILCEQFGEIEKIVYPVPERTEVTAFVRFKEYKGAIRAIQKIPGKKVKKSGILSAVLLTKEGKHPTKKSLQQSRLIIRNLSFKCNENDLCEQFSIFGNVVDVNIPTKMIKEKPCKIGCGFVQFASSVHAKAAITQMNLKEIKGRQVVVDWAVSKEKYSQEDPPQGVKGTESNKEKDGDDDTLEKDSKKKFKHNDVHKNGKETTDNVDKEILENEDDATGKRVKAGKEAEKEKGMKKQNKKKVKHEDIGQADDEKCDTADTSEGNTGEKGKKDKKKKMKKKNLDKENKKDVTDNENVERSGESNYEIGEISGEESNSDSDFANEAEDEYENYPKSDNDDSSESDGEMEEEKPKAQLKDAKEGKTVFVRNLSYKIEEDELTEEFGKHGDIDYCKIVYDRESGRSKGSAFIKFKEKTSADNCVDDFKKKEEQGVNVVLDGRPVIVALAVTKGKLGEIQHERSESKKETDKRNLYLVSEGIITRNSPAADGLSDADLKKREKALTEKRVKLKNQNFFVSRTRLCVQNLPLSIDADGLRTSLMKHVPRKMNIKEIKITRSKDRRDLSGNLRSLGYGFIELESHEDALALLRATNNNPSVFDAKRRPIVEFSVENAKALKIVELKKLRLQTKNVNAVENHEGANLKKEGDKTAKEKIYEKRKKRYARYKRKREEKKVSKNNENGEGVASIQKDDEKTPINTKRDEAINNNDNLKRKFSDIEEPDRLQRKIRKKKKESEEERFTSMVKQYKEKLFGNPSENHSNKTNENRWFE